MPAPGKAIMPIGMASSIASVRLKGAAFWCRVQSGLKTTCATPRLSAHLAAMSSAPPGPGLVEHVPDADVVLGYL